MSLPRCFKCRASVAGQVVPGPICGPAQAHPHCAPVAWHAECRTQWLADLETWAHIAEG